MGNVKELRKENQVQNFGFGTALDTPFVIPLTNSLTPAKGTSTPTFTRSTVGTYVDINGVVQEAAINTPRFEYENGQPKGILIEETRTNLFLNSDAPATQTITVVNATVYTLSVKGSGSIVLSGGGSGTATEGSDVTFTSSSTSVTCTVSGDLDYAQLEAGSFATSFIVTAGSSVTRTADVCSYDVSSVITQGQGSLYCEFNTLGLDLNSFPGICTISDGSSNNYISLLGRESDVSIFSEIRNSGVKVAEIKADPSSFTFNTTHKAVITYIDNNIIFFLDGVKIGIDTSAVVPINLSSLYVGANSTGGSQANSNIKNFKYYSRVLSESEAKRLTG